jgi:hypothetical protein
MEQRCFSCWRLRVGAGRQNRSAIRSRLRPKKVVGGRLEPVGSGRHVTQTSGFPSFLHAGSGRNRDCSFVNLYCITTRRTRRPTHHYIRPGRGVKCSKRHSFAVGVFAVRTNEKATTNDKVVVSPRLSHLRVAAGRSSMFYSDALHREPQTNPTCPSTELSCSNKSPLSSRNTCGIRRVRQCATHSFPHVPDRYSPAGEQAKTD